MEMNATVGRCIARDDRCAAHGQEIAVALDDIADDRILVGSRHTRAGQNDIGRERAIGCRNRTFGDRGRSLAGGVQRTQTIGACKHVAIDFELGVVGHMYLEPAEITDPVMERPNCDRVGHLIHSDRSEWSANADSLFVDRVYFGNDELV